MGELPSTLCNGSSSLAFLAIIYVWPMILPLSCVPSRPIWKLTLLSSSRALSMKRALSRAWVGLWAA
jgi:hypothetical protein